MTTPVTIDGSRGEGGGQIVRSGLALALVTGRPVTIENVRAGRRKPGLMPQHLAAVHAAVAVCGGEAVGDELGSQRLHFEPRPARGGEYYFKLGTAGSATLVLQTVLPALLIADIPSALVLEGGTHNPWAPPFDFLHAAFLPLASRMGPRITAKLRRHGFYPAGGGQFAVEVEPSPKLAGFDLVERGALVTWAARALVAHLPRHIAEREISTVLQAMSWDESCGRVEEVDAIGPGNAVLIELESEHVTEVFTAFGRKGVRAERVAEEAVQQAQTYLGTDAPVGQCLADQLLLPLGISAWQAGDGARKRGGSFRTLPLTTHATTHINVLRQFLEINIQVAADPGPDTLRLCLSPA
jgi:RNA 3'-terminal phosphate cyclase (ATP)